ncbi:copper homeostasis membrane protein CopD [Tardiphaga sp. vice352]|uniref:copper homeostasis membrane protein CopD n=1 Tax=unclassified Tardiphaga TaxID=2631404 RepID=UPI0011653396|nr:MULTISPECIES: copper homeostasis membrane protein CopD [unclassified Tardiphaga]QDM24327.1 copper homeostasis membrane protein CopD [Tardiphaga sp. vice154]QDM29535.1 copper homeostasis membrane protein CopD [Tardiphaga sp. vice304]QDM34644.1 copper homeostasis membrane protein CopD [Tardiphaga sp. vice352]
MIDLGLVVARFLHYVASTTLAGAAFFPLYAYAGAEPETLVRWRSKVLRWSAFLALISGLAWFAFSVANMSGALADLADPEIVGSVLRDTGFGVVWTVRMIVAAALVAVTILQSSSRATVGLDLVTSFLAAGLLASLAGAGHSQIEEGWQGLVHVAADAGHLLAAGAWLGGLAPLGFILLGYAGTRTGPGAVDVDGVLMRFSGMGYAAVATLVGTGLVNSWLLVGSVSSLLHSTYGQILMAKLAFFAGMLALAAANRFWLVPALEASGRGDTDGSAVWRSKLRTHVLSEQGLGLLVLLSVSILGTIRPAIGQ